MLRVRPSDALVFECPASVRAREAAGPQVETEAMAVGTALHDLVAASWVIGGAAAFRHSLERLPDWAEELVADAVLALDHLRAKFPAYRVSVETPLEMGHRVGLARDAWCGTADYLLVSPDGDHAIVADLKTGLTPVEATSRQLRAYLVGALDCAPELTRATAVIIQPRTPDRVLVHDYTRSEIDQFVSEMATLVPLALSPAAPFKAGPHCHNCHAIGACPAGADYVVAQFAGAAAVEWRADALSNDRLAAILAAAPLLEKMVEAVKAEATSRLEAGQAIPGFVLGRRVTQRRWADPAQFLAEVERLGLPADVFAPRKPLSPAAALRAVDAEHMSALEALVVKPAGAVTVLPEKQNAGDVRVDLGQLLPVLFT